MVKEFKKSSDYFIKEINKMGKFSSKERQCVGKTAEVHGS